MREAGFEPAKALSYKALNLAPLAIPEHFSVNAKQLDVLLHVHVLRNSGKGLLGNPRNAGGRI